MDVFSQVFEFLINRPLVMLLAMAAPLALVAAKYRLYPNRRMLYLLGLPAISSLALVLFPLRNQEPSDQFWMVLVAILIMDGGLVLLAILDAVLIVKSSAFRCQRQILRIASQGKKYEVELELTNLSRRGCRIVLKDDWPPETETDPEQFETRIGGISQTRFSYDFTVQQRGLVELECVHVIVLGPLGLWRGFYEIPVASTVNVYPDMQQITEYDLLARTNRLSLMGLRRTRKIGQDNEFERLRDYTEDDNYKHIDWRTTARRRKLTVRDFQANQSQRIIFMLDCGRMMTGTSGDRSLLDHSINAMLMLSYVALRQGDSVGLLSYSNRIHNFSPPRSGVKHINRLLHATYNLEPMHVESRYDEAFLYLRNHCPKRSLVVLVTNVIDDINALQLQQYLGLVTGRHLPVAALLRDHDIYQAVDEYDELPQPGNALTFQAAAAANVLSWRHQVIRDLKHQGVLAMDVFPEQLTAELVNQYLEIKARHLL